MDGRIDIILMCALKFREIIDDRGVVRLHLLDKDNEYILYSDKFTRNAAYTRLNLKQSNIDIVIRVGVIKSVFSMNLIELEKSADIDFVITRYFARVIEYILDL